MSRILDLVNMLLESDNKDAEFVTIRPEEGSDSPAWLLNVKVVGPKSWNYFEKNVEIKNGSKIYMNDKYWGDINKDEDGYIATKPNDPKNVLNDNIKLHGSTVVEAVFRFLKYYCPTL